MKLRTKYDSQRPGRWLREGEHQLPNCEDLSLNLGTFVKIRVWLCVSAPPAEEENGGRKASELLGHVRCQLSSNDSDDDKNSGLYMSKRS